MEEKKLTGYPSIDKPWMNYYPAGCDKEPVPQRTIYEMLLSDNQHHPESIAINYYDRRFTYGQVFDRVDAAARSYAALGVKKGDVVVVCTVNTPEVVYTLYALNRLGAVANMVDPRTNVDGIREYILETDSRLVMTIDLAYPAIAKAIKGTKVDKVIVVSPADSLPPVTKALYHLKNKAVKCGPEAISWKEFSALGEGVTPEFVPFEKDTCCVMAHTGGTTGFPKAVMLSNENLNAVVHSYHYIDVPLARGQKYFNDLPPFIVYGLSVSMHAALCLGQEVILYPVFDSKAFPKVFAKYKPNHFCALPDHLKYLSTDKRTAKMDLSFLIIIGVGGDSLDTELERSVNAYLKERGCRFQVLKGYGMTELGATAVTTFGKANAIGSVGIPMMVNTIKIVDPDTLEELPIGQSGEVWIGGPAVMLGYYNKPEENAEIIVTDENGLRWIRTGDLGRLNEDGMLFHQGRIRRIYMTACAGQPAKIFPMVVEDAIRKSGEAAACSVVGRKRRGSDYYEAVAFVVKKDPAADEARITGILNARCAESVPSYMVPADYRFVTELPHTPIGKVDFRALEKAATEAMEV